MESYTPFKKGDLIVVQPSQVARALASYERNSNLFFGLSGQWREDELMAEASYKFTPAKNDWDEVDRTHHDGQLHDSKIALTGEDNRTAISHTVGVRELPVWVPHVEAGGDVLISSWIQMQHHGLEHRFMGLLSFKAILAAKRPDGKPLLTRKTDGTAYFIRSIAYAKAMVQC
jgi:hypothetical protein